MPFFGESKTIAGKTDTRQRYNMMVMPSLSGKSKILEELAKYTGAKRVVPIDVDALAMGIVDGDPALKPLNTAANASVLEALLFKKLEEKFLEILKTLVEDVVLAVTSNTYFVDHLQCKDKREYIFLPAPDLYAQMLKELEQTQGADAAKTLQASRDSILMWSKEKPKVTTYTCLADIAGVLAKEFELRLSAY